MLALALAALGGAIIALLLALFGGGGSVLATPWLLFVVGVSDAHVAIGTGAAAVAVNGLAGLLAQARAGAVKWPCALVFGLAGLAGAWAGAGLAQRVPGQALLAGFGVAMALVGLAMLRRPASGGDPAVRLDAARTLKLAPIGLGVGLAAGFFGIGGGFLIVPGLMAATGMTMLNAAASSLVSVVLFAVASGGRYALAGQVDAGLFAALALGGLAGVGLGRVLAPRLAARALLMRRLFAMMVLATAALVLARAL